MLPIVLIHGFPLDNAMWQAQVEYLTAKGHTVIAPNLPGFGNPPTPPIPLEYATIDAYAEFIHGIIQQQQGKKAQARRKLAEVYGWFTEGFATKDLQEANALLTALS